jgi:hypothetical protein
MFTIRVIPDRLGFWVFLDFPEGFRYSIEYFALGPGGHQVSGDLSGLATGRPTWQFQRLPFPAVRVGITQCAIEPREGGRLVDRPQHRVSAPFASPKAEEPKPGFPGLFDSSFSAPFGPGRAAKPRNLHQSDDESPSEAESPYGLETPYGLGVPHGLEVPYGFEIPYGLEVPYGFEIPYGLEVPYGFEIPYGLELPYGLGTSDRSEDDH